MNEKYNSSSHREGKMAAVVWDEAANRKRAIAKPEPVVGFRKTKSEDSLKGVKVVSPFNLSPNFYNWVPGPARFIMFNDCFHNFGDLTKVSPQPTIAAICV